MLDFSEIFVEPLQDADPKYALMKALEQNEEAILDLNRQQLDRGLDARGNSLGKYKSFKYKNRWTPVDLKLTGAWRGKFTLQVKENESEIFSQDQKEEKLKAKYGKDIEGIPNYLIPNMQAIIEEDFVRNFQSLLLITTQTNRI
jgi:hypothetical protein